MKRIIASLTIIATLAAVPVADATIRPKGATRAIEDTVAEYVAPLLRPDFGEVAISTKRCHPYKRTRWTACRVIARGVSRCSMVVHFRRMKDDGFGIWVPRMNCQRATSR